MEISIFGFFLKVESWKVFAIFFGTKTNKLTKCYGLEVSGRAVKSCAESFG
jgi:hypothetical protein